ncbi:MAG: hypothetical protein M1816_008017 [Peltula sp. TS41687]|nr:MAG: hypothetical protein M1816_008017 [Peltula sp. TS41687]
MHISHLLTAALAAGISTASPIEKRQLKVTDVLVLNYALTLEFLERKFYREGLANYTREEFIDAGFEDPFYSNLKVIAYDEETHVDFLTKAIIAAGATPVKEATYAFGVTDAKSFVALSSVLEGVGVSAYLGAAASIMEKAYLTAAGTILTVEARHSAYIRSQLGEQPFPAPFDTPLGFNEVFSLAAGFIKSFAPGDAPLPFKAFPPLMLSCSQFPYVAGSSSVTFTNAAKMYPAQSGCPIYAAFFSGLEPYIIPVKTVGHDYVIEKLPAGISGQTYVVLTKDPAKATDDTIIAGPAILEVYRPTNYTMMPDMTCPGMSAGGY